MQDWSYNIVPFQKVGMISFLDNREQIRDKIGGRVMDGEYVFEDIIELYDYFPDSDIKVLYDRYEHLGAVEFFRGKVLFENKDIFNLSYKEVEIFFQKIDSELETEMGFTSYKYGIGVGRDEENDTITSVIVFRKNYLMPITNE